MDLSSLVHGGLSNLSCSFITLSKLSTYPCHMAAPELHHGHGGEDAPLSDGAAPLPGGRPGGDESLDSALQ